MFEQLFGSKTRVKIMRIFLENPDKKFFVRELTRLSDSLINSVRRELDNLIDLGLIKVQELKPKESGEAKGLNTKRYYHLNKKNLFHKDLLNLFNKGKLLVEKKFLDKIKALGEVKYVSLGGFFAEDDKAKTDILIIGTLEREKAAEAFKKFEIQIGRPINYTILDEEEFKLRRDIADKFLSDIISNEKNIVVVDKLRQKDI
ncbi:MAG: hypothetical protein V1928_05380 [Parcubacteria group bacterium]